MKIAVIGCGKQSEKHIEGLRKSSGAGIPVVVADLDPARAEALAKTQTNCAAVSIDAALTDPEVAGVIICTPTKSHAALSARAMENGKHVLCEKPLSDSLEEAEALAAVSARTGKKVAVGYIYRQAPRFAAAQALMAPCRDGGAAKGLGRMVSALFRIGGRGDHAVWKHMQATGGGALNEMFVHMLDLATWFFGPIQGTEVVSKRIMRPNRTIGGESFVSDAEDYVMVKLTTTHGMELFIEADLATPGFIQYVDVAGENGNLFTSVLGDFPSFAFLKGPADGLNGGRTDMNPEGKNFYINQTEKFLGLLRGESDDSLHMIEDSVALMRVMKQIVQG